MGNLLDLQRAVLELFGFSKMRIFTSEFYKVVNYSGNTLLQVENVICTRLGLFFPGGTTV